MITKVSHLLYPHLQQPFSTLPSTSRTIQSFQQQQQSSSTDSSTKDMPRSKRNRLVSLTKTRPKGKDAKTKLIESLREFLDEYSDVYVFTYNNLKSSNFRKIRSEWRESKLFLGKNSVAQIAFGRSIEEEYKDNLRSISARLEGDVGVLFTNRPFKEVKAYFSKYNVPEFAKAGETPNQSHILPAGPLPQFPISMMDQFRKLGLIVEIDDTMLMLRESYVAAEEGVVLTPEQAKVLTHFGIQLATFRITLDSHWRNNGNFEELA